MILEAIIFLVGIALLVKGADLFVGGGSGLASRFGISAATIGFTVIAFGTSLPEFVVSVNAVAAGDPGIALGNVLGSNIANIALVLAICAFIRPTLVGSGGADMTEIGLMLFATALFIICAFRGVFDALAGIVMLAAFVVILTVLWQRGGVENDGEGIRSHGRRDILMTVGGLAAVVIGAQFVVDGATAIATSFGIPTIVIGLSMVAVGTSLPELATSIMAIMRREEGISVGNILGSNIFNLLFVIGVGALIAPIPVISPADILATALFSAAVVPLFLGGERFTRIWSAGLLVGYAGYIALIFNLL
ncbi:calcium/sodium antiporter [Methanofollis fontis]|uniref:Conjugal transfer protein TraR n=1 Tax=Methanofollis fontis TaxID=2052832 RepID=A0A483CUZ9_9EURY|nr:calcium/sodium antiporter [Methanofollis fontis]TAJ45291.1 conjugal transfer protein TraR [Methanofollis fontis]